MASKPMPPSSEDGPLIPPQPMFALEASGGVELKNWNRVSSHSRNTSTTPSTVDSPPMSPKSSHRSTLQNPNPFSPPASVVNFSIRDSHTLMRSSDSPAPSTFNSRAPSISEVPRGSLSWYAGGSRPGTPNVARDPFNSPSRRSLAPMRDSMRAPPPRPLTLSSTVSLSSKVARERSKTTLLSASRPEGVQKPWLEKHDPFTRIAYFITYGAIFLGFVGGALKCYFGWNQVNMLTGNLCLVMDEEFTGGEDGIFGDNGKFLREVDMSGFGNGEFEMTTASQDNSFVRDGKLYIVPTLTSATIGEEAILDGHVYNITDCTYNVTHGSSYTLGDPPSENETGSNDDFDAAAYYRACSAVSNHSMAQIINPIQTARLNTRHSASIKHGRVEVRAKLPTGDWLWPAIWMLPVENTYGHWPMSGEIDIMESRGNGPRYPNQGSNVVRGSLNWGPLSSVNAVSKTFGWRAERRGRYDREWHTYALEWTEDFIRIFVDDRLHYMFEMKIKKSFWDLGDFPRVVQTNEEVVILENPWGSGTKAAPFDQPFYLILSLGVGGTNGWFPDGIEKPWLDNSPNAMAEFWRRKDEWYPTWGQTVEDRAFIIDSVKMWQKC